MEEEDEEKEKTGGRGGSRCSSAADAWVAGDHRARWGLEELLSSGLNRGEKAAGRWLLE